MVHKWESHFEAILEFATFYITVVVISTVVKRPIENNKIQSKSKNMLDVICLFTIVDYHMQFLDYLSMPLRVYTGKYGYNLTIRYNMDLSIDLSVSKIRFLKFYSETLWLNVKAMVMSTLGQIQVMKSLQNERFPAEDPPGSQFFLIL